MLEIPQERLSQLEALKLEHGSHPDREDGMCVMEAVAWLAGEDHSDAPSCVSPVIRRFLIALNDRYQEEDRQRLKVLIPLVVGTVNPALEEQRRWMLVDWALRTAAPDWLRHLGMTSEADTLAALPEITSREVYNTHRPAIRAIGDAAWARRREAFAAVRAKVAAAVREQLGPNHPRAEAAEAEAEAAEAEEAEGEQGAPLIPQRTLHW